MSRVAVVCHDAGGAEILSSWLLRSNDLCVVVLEGPAIDIFNRKCPDAEGLSLGEAIERADWVLCGTSWSSDLEREAIQLCRKKEKKTIAFLDHWVNYKERFQNHDGSFSFPDEIWVGDKEGYLIAQTELPGLPVTLQTNPYLDDIYDLISNTKPSKTKTNKISILYVCEPIRDHAYIQYGDEFFWGYTEESALKYFLKNFECLQLDIALITIRPHPSEDPNKYQWAKTLAPELIKFGGNKSLVQETIDADVVVGCESMAMVVGLVAGKRVISSIPPGGNPLQLPQTKIEKMHELIRRF